MQDNEAVFSVLAGSTLGGGTRVNWCASFRTPAHVRKEWSADLGLEAFAGAEYERALDAVCERLHVRTGALVGVFRAREGGVVEGFGSVQGGAMRTLPRCTGHCKAQHLN